VVCDGVSGAGEAVAANCRQIRDSDGARTHFERIGIDSF
jgi:hypothetical protein